MAEGHQPPQGSPPRRSTRIATDVVLDIKTEQFAYGAQTITVNLHGALITTSARLPAGTSLTVYVHATGKAARARIVFASTDDPPQYGIELEQPANIWGID